VHVTQKQPMSPDAKAFVIDVLYPIVGCDNDHGGLYMMAEDYEDLLAAIRERDAAFEARIDELERQLADRDLEGKR
jgi:hypothetical protein